MRGPGSVQKGFDDGKYYVAVSVLPSGTNEDILRKAIQAAFQDSGKQPAYRVIDVLGGYDEALFQCESKADQSILNGQVLDIGGFRVNCWIPPKMWVRNFRRKRQANRDPVPVSDRPVYPASLQSQHVQNNNDCVRRKQNNYNNYNNYHYPAPKAASVKGRHYRAVRQPQAKRVYHNQPAPEPEITRYENEGREEKQYNEEDDDVKREEDTKGGEAEWQKAIEAVPEKEAENNQPKRQKSEYDIQRDREQLEEDKYVYPENKKIPQQLKGGVFEQFDRFLVEKDADYFWQRRLPRNPDDDDKKDEADEWKTYSFAENNSINEAWYKWRHHDQRKHWKRIKQDRIHFDTMKVYRSYCDEEQTFYDDGYELRYTQVLIGKICEYGKIEFCGEYFIYDRSNAYAYDKSKYAASFHPENEIRIHDEVQFSLTSNVLGDGYAYPPQHHAAMRQPGTNCDYLAFSIRRYPDEDKENDEEEGAEIDDEEEKMNGNEWEPGSDTRMKEKVYKKRVVDKRQYVRTAKDVAMEVEIEYNYLAKIPNSYKAQLIKLCDAAFMCRIDEKYGNEIFEGFIIGKYSVHELMAQRIRNKKQRRNAKRRKKRNQRRQARRDINGAQQQQKEELGEVGVIVCYVASGEPVTLFYHSKWFAVSLETAIGMNLTFQIGEGGIAYNVQKSEQGWRSPMDDLHTNHHIVRECRGRVVMNEDGEIWVQNDMSKQWSQIVSAERYNNHDNADNEFRKGLVGKYNEREVNNQHICTDFVPVDQKKINVEKQRKLNADVFVENIVYDRISKAFHLRYKFFNVPPAISEQYSDVWVIIELMEQYANACWNDGTCGLIVFGLESNGRCVGQSGLNRKKRKYIRDVMDLRLSANVSVNSKKCTYIRATFYELHFLPVVDGNGYEIPDTYVIRMYVYALNGNIIWQTSQKVSYFIVPPHEQPPQQARRKQPVLPIPGLIEYKYS